MRYLNLGDGETDSTLTVPDGGQRSPGLLPTGTATATRKKSPFGFPTMRLPASLLQVITAKTKLPLPTAPVSAPPVPTGKLDFSFIDTPKSRMALYLAVGVGGYFLFFRGKKGKRGKKSHG